MIKTFIDFIDEKKAPADSSGIAIVYDNKILLVHPTNSSWVKPTLGIPKGRIDGNEDLLEAAIRETSEETGILINPSQLDKYGKTIEVHKDGKYIRTINYFECRISSLEEIGLQTLVVPRNQLQLEEIDWAGFIDISKAYPKMAKSQLILLDRLR